MLEIIYFTADIAWVHDSNIIFGRKKPGIKCSMNISIGNDLQYFRGLQLNTLCIYSEVSV